MNSFKDIAYQILKEVTKPLHSKEITKIALQRGWLKTAGKTPEATMNTQLIVDINSKKEKSRFVKIDPSVFGLSDNFKKTNNISESKGNKIILTNEQKGKIKKYYTQYQNWLKTDEGNKNLEDHLKHSNFISNKLAKDKIDNLTEEDFRGIYKNLWASNIWSNKDWYIDNKLLKPNGFEKIKVEFKKLLFGEDSIDVRYDNFISNIKGLGASSLTEILNFVFPDKYCLWNDKPITVLPVLGLNIFLPDRLFKYSLHLGSDYVKCNEVLGLIKSELELMGFKSPNYIDVDCVVWYIFLEITSKKEKVATVKEDELNNPKKEIFESSEEIKTHEQAEFYLLKTGESLGYLTYTVDSPKLFNNTKLGDVAILKDIPDFAGQRDKNSAREIDVIWFDEGENPKFCLEVEHTTDITKGLNRLLQLQHFNVTFVIVSSEDKRSKFEIEMNKFPYRKLKDRYRFISYDELLELYGSVLKFRELKDKLLD